MSSVGGGPMERLARKLQDCRIPARIVNGQSPERWRALMASGTAGRMRARIGAMIAFPLRALSDSILRRGSVLIPTTNPFFLPALLVATRPLHRQPVVPLIYDLYPDALEAGGMVGDRGVVVRLGMAANRFLFRAADGVVFIGKRMAEHARARYGEPRRWTVLETGADLGEFGDEAGQSSLADSDLGRWCEGKLILGYVGNLGIVHDWRTFAELVPILLETTHVPVGVVVAASGPGVEFLREAWARLPDAQVRFVRPLEDREWARLLRRIDLSIVTLRAEARQTSIPSKTFSAMAAGSAIAAIAPEDSDVADVVGRHGCGLVLPPGDPEGAARAIGALVSNPVRLGEMRAAARRAVREEYDMSLLAERWSQFLAPELARGGGKRGDAAKRALDALFAASALVLLSPLLLAVAGTVWAAMGRPVLFRQERPGLGGRPFRLLKFRTMRQPRPGEEGPQSDALRLTKVGALLRATSIDELPTLVNVLKGEMSLVGPRPLLMRYLPRYSARQARRHEVRPGITGWAQVNGRNAISWEEKFELDVWYVENRSLWLDLMILMRTALKVLRREGISSAGHATMPEFRGSRSGEGEV